ncbi:MAG: protein kinase [Polyangiaceae bacterium]
MWNDPEVFGGFLLVRRLADSAMASVSLGVRLGDPSGRPLVVKRPPLGERASGRAAQAILREAEVLSAVRGSGIPSLEAAGDIAGLPYVAVERLRGATLAKVIAASGALPIAAVVAVGRDVARALARLHEAGWVHRDVTPSNLFIDEAGEAYLLDYGLCERAGDERGAPVAGTRGYAAPETPTTAAARPSQDVYGLAVCLAEAALGKRLFDESSLVEAAARGDAPPRAVALEADLPGIEAALRRDPGARPTAQALAESLSRSPRSPEDPSGSSLLAELTERAQSAATDSSPAPAPKPEAVAIALPKPARAVTPVHEVADPARPHPLAARAPETVFGPPPKPLTPTVAMPAVVVREVPPRESEVLETLPDLSAPPPRTPLAAPTNAPSIAPVHGTVARPPRGPKAWQLAVAAACAALVIGFFSGRFSRSAAHGGASFALSGPLPKRAEVLLDGKKLTVADGVPMPIPPGAHTLTIASPKQSKREVPFTARPGEHVVIVSPLKSAQPDEPGDNFATESRP